MLDLIVLGFQMDNTRVVTCMLNHDLSQMNFKFLEAAGARVLRNRHARAAALARALKLP